MKDVGMLQNTKYFAMGTDLEGKSQGEVEVKEVRRASYRLQELLLFYSEHFELCEIGK